MHVAIDYATQKLILQINVVCIRIIAKNNYFEHMHIARMLDQ